ncbi:MAG TPA: hypothetical protein VK874_03725 [Gaiellaceae bacterium]|nr:hypothetical protein [Gaiellaceae bacterium]
MNRARARLAAPVAALPLVVLTGCAGRVDATSPGATPTELQTREAYLDTPVVTDDQGRAVEPGSTRREVEGRLGHSRVVYRHAGRTCLLYPIIGTQRRDEFGSPVADEWELCFDASGRLAAKALIRNSNAA